MISEHLGGDIFTIVYRILYLWKMLEPRFCETLQCFHHMLGDMTLPEGTIKQKSKPSELSLILAMTKTDPTRIFQHLTSKFDTIWGNISQLIQASVSSTQKCKKFESRSLARRRYPGRITEEGEPRDIHLRFSPVVQATVRI